MPHIPEPQSPIPGRLKGLHLFHFDGAPCAQRVRFALGEKGLHRGREEQFDDVSDRASKDDGSRWVSRRVSLPRKQHMTDIYAAIHPDMVVPALVHNGRLWLESMDIIAYLDAAFGGPALVPTDPTLRQATMDRVEEAKRLHVSIRYVSFHWGLGGLAFLKKKEQEQLARLAAQGHDAENLVAFYAAYSQQSIPLQIYRDHLAKLFEAFARLDSELADGRLFLMSDDVTIADAFWSMKVLKMIECGYPVRERHPNLFAWYRRVAARPSFRNEVMRGNRLMHWVFRTKSAFQKMFGGGLARALEEVAHDKAA